MGIVLKQTFKNLATTYLGFAVGALNVLLLYPHFLEREYYGIVTTLLSAETLVVPFLALGMPNTLIKFFSLYKSDKEREGLLSLTLIAPLVSGLFFGCLGLIFYEFIQQYFDTNPGIKPFTWLIFIIAIANAYFQVFFNWSKLKLKSVFGNFMREVFHRVVITGMLLLVFAKTITVTDFIYLLAGVYFLRMLIMMGYAFYLIPPKIHFKLPDNLKSILKYSVLILVVGLAAGVLLDLDKTMIPHYMPIGNVAVYAIAVYIATVIEVPAKAMRQITHPITATYLNTENWLQLNTLYKKSSITLLVMSGLIFSLIICNLNQFYTLIPDEYHIDVIIVVLLAIIKLLRNLVGINGSILMNSDYYHWLLFTALSTVVLAFVLNYFMIPAYGLYGAAIASFITFILYDFFKLWVVFTKYRIHPFTKNTFVLLGFIVIITGVFYSFQFSGEPILGIILKSAVISAVYLAVVYFSNFSDDITSTLNRFRK